ncbi:MAG: VanZ family protein [Candidatus Manganitrophaceae bacterium]
MWVLIALTVVFLAARTAMAEERVHLLEYGVLGYLTARAIWRTLVTPGSSGCERMNLLPLSIVAFGLVFLIGVGDELIQGQLPNRVFDLHDILLNAVGGAAGILSYYANSAADSP